MSAQNIRIMKEARALFWPWCGVMVLGALHMTGGAVDFGQAFTAIGFVAGIPLLAALSFGNEFQYRTASLLLSEPVSRLEIWREKLAVMLIATISVTLVYYLAWRQVLESNLFAWVIFAAFLVMIVGSSTLWILIARSTLGGLILNVGLQFGILIVVSALFGVVSLNNNVAAAYVFPYLASGLVAALCYAVAMLWLGWRRLAGFQAIGEATGNDLLSNRPKFIPESVAGLFRWEPEGATQNLVKKELRLLRPVWLLTLAWIAFLLVLVPFRSVLNHAYHFDTVAVVVMAMYLVLVGILAGSVSMGEERQLGTHSANLMLPVSVRCQWLIKFGSNVFTSAVCGLLIIAAAYFLIGAQSQNELRKTVNEIWTHYPELFWVYLFEMLLLTFPSFWSGCAVHGTVRAAAWTLPLLALIGSATAVARVFATAPFFHTLADQIVLVTHPFPVGQRLSSFSYGSPLGDLIFWAPPLAVGIFQSYRMFKREQPEAVSSLIRHVAVIWIVLLLCNLGQYAVADFVGTTYWQENTALHELAAAIDKLPLDPLKLDAVHSHAVSTEELNQVYPLSKETRAWLGNATVSVTPKPSSPASQRLRLMRNGKYGPPTAKFAANVDFSNGWKCRVYGGFYACLEPGQQPYPVWERLF